MNGIRCLKQLSWRWNGRPLTLQKTSMIMANQPLKLDYLPASHVSFRECKVRIWFHLLFNQLSWKFTGKTPKSSPIAWESFQPQLPERWRIFTGVISVFPAIVFNKYIWRSLFVWLSPEPRKKTYFPWNTGCSKTESLCHGLWNTPHITEEYPHKP